MRNEQEILDLIMDTARADERIRVVILSGSRANPNAPQDPFQDFDIAYLVTDVAPFMRNHEWIERFGEIMIMQMPEDMQDPPPVADGRFVYLMQFTDGNRIDLSIYPLAGSEEFTRDSVSVVLLDKDGLIEPLSPADESDHLPSPPDAKAYVDCCNEFWWVCTYVAKGLWRREILYARYHLDRYVRDQLMKMVMWYVGLTTESSRNPGKYGRYLEQYLDPETWQMLLRTYSDAAHENTWEALHTTCRLFRKVAIPVAKHCGFDYRYEDDKRVSAHLRHVQCLPCDARNIYG